MGASLLEMFEMLSSHYLRVHPNRCVVVRNRHASCRNCANACTHGAIILNPNGNELHVDAEMCVGCGTCATVCPTGALEAMNPTDVRLANDCLNAATQAGDGELAIACERAVKPVKEALSLDKLATVVCLGRVDESLLANLATRDVERIWLVRGDCDSCELARGRATAKRVAESFNALMGAWGLDAQAKVTRKFPLSAAAQERGGFDPSKRALFAWMKDGGKEAVASEIEELLGAGDSTPEQDRQLKVGDNGTLPQAVPSRRDFLLDALASLDLPPDGPLASRLWGHVEIDAAKCSACKACVTFCPTGALAGAESDDSEYVIDHRPGACVKCRSCEDICRKGAITVHDDVTVADITEDRTLSHVIEMPSNRVRPGNMAATMRTLISTAQVTD